MLRTHAGVIGERDDAEVFGVAHEPALVVGLREQGQPDA